MKITRFILPLFLFLGVFQLYAANTSERRLFLEAEGRFSAKEYGFAYQRYSEFIVTFPRSDLIPDAQFRRAQCLYRMGQLEEALALFSRVSVRYPSTKYRDYIPFWLGVVYYDLGKFEDSLSSLERLNLGPGDPLAAKGMLYKGLSLYRLERPAESLAVFSEGFGFLSNPLNEPALPVFYTSLLVRTGEYEKALNLINSLPLDSFPQEWKERLILTRGEAYIAIGDAEEGETAFRMLLAARPDVAAGAYQRLFRIYQERDDDTELARILLGAEQALAGNRDILSEFWLRIGIESYSKNKYDLALGYLQRVWNTGSLKTVDPLVPLYMAEIYARERSFGQASDIISRYLAVNNSGKELLLFRLGNLHIQAENWLKAGDILSSFIEAYKDSEYYPEAAYLYAYSLYKKGSFGDSLRIVETSFSEAATGRFTDRFYRLASVLYRRAGDTDKAITSLRNYIGLRPEDIKARMDLLKLYNSAGRHQQILEEVKNLERSGLIHPEDTHSLVFSRYMGGLASTALKDYAGAIGFFSGITDKQTADAGLSVIYPYLLFYDGWAHFRTGRYSQAMARFVPVSEAQIPLSVRASYLAGWSAYSLGDFAKAEPHFLRYSITAAGYDRDKGSLMYGKSLAGQKKYNPAGLAFAAVYSDSLKSPYAVDALFEHASVLLLENKVDSAADLYKRVYNNYRENPLAEEALYKRAEAFYSAKAFGKARDAFYDYRTAYERGKYGDASLYWGGLASFQLKEEYGAVLLWERLLEEYRESSYRPDTLRRTADFYKRTGDFRKSLVLYTELLALYPEEAKAFGADMEAEKLRFLLLGQSEREAELMAVRSRERGAATERGRAATLELAKIYINKDDEGRDIALSLLNEITARKDTDPSAAAQAQYLLGEYYFRKNELKRAGEEFLLAATMNPKDLDLMAASIFKAAEMAKLSGNLRDAQALVKRLEDNFPQSQWAAEGRKLVGGSR